MKILAPFATVCLILLTLVIWQMQSGATPPAPEIPKAAAGAEPSTPSRKNVVTPRVEPAPAISIETGDRPTTPPVEQPKIADPAERTTAAHPPPVEEDDDAGRSRPIRWAGEGAKERKDKARLNELRAVLLHEPDNIAAVEDALAIARRNEWHNEIRELLSRLARQRPDDDAPRYQLAVELMRSKRWVEALPHLTEVARARPDDAQVHYNLAITLQALAHLNQARAAWRRVIELMPDNPDAYVHRGEVLLDLREWSAAAADFEKSLEAAPDDLALTLNLALALTKLGQPDEAYRRLAPMLDDHPGHVPLLNRLAEISWMIYQANPGKNLDQARETMEYCDRSLARLKAQPEIGALRALAAEACKK